MLPSIPLPPTIQFLMPARALSGGTASAMEAMEKCGGDGPPNFPTALRMRLLEEKYRREHESSTFVIAAAAYSPLTYTPELPKTTKKIRRQDSLDTCRDYPSIAPSKNMTPSSKTE